MGGHHENATFMAPFPEILQQLDWSRCWHFYQVPQVISIQVVKWTTFPETPVQRVHLLLGIRTYLEQLHPEQCYS